MRVYKIADQLIARSFHLLFFLVPLIFTSLNFELFEFNKMLLTYALTVIIVSAWVTKSILAGRLIFRRTFLDIPFLLFLSSQLLSTIYSIDPHTSIWGYYSRSHGGLLSTISYLLLYWAYVSNMDYKKTLSSILYLLSSGTIVAVWGIFEHFGKSPSCLILRGNFDTSCWIQDAQSRVFASLGQPNWLAAFLVAIMPLAWQKLINANSDESKANKQSLSSIKSLFAYIRSPFVSYSLIVLLFLALLFTKSRSGLLGFGVAYAVFWAISFLHLNKLVFRPFFLLITSYLLLVAIFGSPWTPTSLEQRTQNTIISAAGGIALETGLPAQAGGTESGEIRKIVWRGALNVWKAYPIFGSGVETFAYSYYQFRSVEHNLTSEWDFLYNKAHNEYLNFLSTTGIVGLGSYLLLIFAFLAWVIHKLMSTNSSEFPANKKSFVSIRTHSLNSLLVTSILAGYVSILVTNFFGFSVVTTATLFFLFPAMAMSVTGDMAQVISLRDKFSFKQFAAIFVLLLVTCYLLLQILQIWRADTLYAKATELNKNGESLSAIEVAEKAVTLRPDEPVYYNELAKGLGHLAVSLAEAGDISQAITFAKGAIEAQDRATTISPLNLNFLKARSALFFDLTSVDPKYLEDSALTLEKAVEIAPTEPKVFYNLGVIYDRLGKTKEAQEVFKRALELKPNYEDARVAIEEINKKLVQ